MWNHAEWQGVWARTDVDPPRMIVTRCGVLELTFEGPGIPAERQSGILGMLASGSNEERVPAGIIEAGTPLMWPDGRRAGTATEQTTRTDLAPRDAPQTCMNLKLGLNWRTTGYRDAVAIVCVDTAAIQPTTVHPSVFMP